MNLFRLLLAVLGRRLVLISFLLLVRGVDEQVGEAKSGEELDPMQDPPKEHDVANPKRQRDHGVLEPRELPDLSDVGLVVDHGVGFDHGNREAEVQDRAGEHRHGKPPRCVDHQSR